MLSLPGEGGEAPCAAYAGKVSASPVVGRLGPDGPTLVDPDQPVVTVDDLGLTRGDGCFDSALVLHTGAGHEVRDLDDHLDRLFASAAALEIDPPDRQAWHDLVGLVVAAWPDPVDASLKLVLTRGREWRPDAGPTAFAVVQARPAGRPQRGNDPSRLAGARTLRIGEGSGADAPGAVSVVTLSRGHPSDAFVDAPWLLGGVKTLSYVVNVAAQREARRRDADDVIFTTTDGFALDAPMAGLLVVHQGRVLTTPTEGTGILESVSVTSILRQAEADGWVTARELIPTPHLFAVDGVWLVASSRGPTPVGEIDGQPVPVDAGLVADVARWAGF